MRKPARARADQASSEVHERTQLAIQAGGVGIWELDFNDGRFIWDDRMHELYGLPPETFSGSLNEWETFLFDEDRRRVLDEWTAAVEGPGGFDTEFRIQWCSGELRHIRALAHVVRRSDGTPLRAVGTNWDITSHKRLTEQLFEEKERLRTTLYSIGDAVICTDAEARITFMNPVAERMTGWLSTDAVSRFAREVFLAGRRRGEQRLRERSGNRVPPGRRADAPG